jgi:hypothetical protein
MINDIILIEDFIGKEDSDYFINKHDIQDASNVGRLKTAVPLPVDNNTIQIFQKYIKKIKDIIEKEDIYVSGVIIARSLPGGSIGLHTDVEDDLETYKLSGVIYLNNDFVGGDIVFPNFPYRYSPKAGDLILFNSQGEKYFHLVEDISLGKRYAMPIWMTDVKEKAIPYLFENELN